MKDRSLIESPEEEDEVFDTPVDLSSDEEYFAEESRSSPGLESQARSALITSKRPFPKKNMQKTRQNFDKKVNRIRTRIVTPERERALRQSGRLRQSGETEAVRGEV